MPAMHWMRVPERPATDREINPPVVVMVRTLLLFESAMYAALTPVLPHYAHVLHAAKPAIGLLTASYPAGIIPGSLLGAALAVRAGVRRATLTGLIVFALAIAAFGFGTDIAVLDALRFVQGAACGLIWGGGLTWVIAVAPRERRGEMLGSVMSAAIVGTLIGPILGTLAVAAGTGPVFALVGAVSLGLAGWTLRHPDPPSPGRIAEASPRALLHNPRMGLGIWLILVEACAIGATGTLLPLRLARFGATGAEIGAAFLLSSLLASVVAPVVGRVVDRRGSRLPLVVGVLGTAILLALLPVPHSVLLLGALTAVALGGPLCGYTIPAISMITESVEHAGVALIVGTTVLNLSWAIGETIGAPAAAGLSQMTSDAVPLIGLAAIMLVTLVPVLRMRLTAPPRAGGPDTASRAPRTAERARAHAAR
jgi:MFS family permease